MQIESVLSSRSDPDVDLQSMVVDGGGERGRMKTAEVTGSDLKED